MGSDEGVGVCCGSVGVGVGCGSVGVAVNTMVEVAGTICVGIGVEVADDGAGVGEYTGVSPSSCSDPSVGETLVGRISISPTTIAISSGGRVATLLGSVITALIKTSLPISVDFTIPILDRKLPSLKPPCNVRAGSMANRHKTIKMATTKTRMRLRLRFSVPVFS